MKILLDVVVTAVDPSKCSTNIQFLTFVRQQLEKREDVFFYWLIPNWITEEHFQATYPQHENVRYIRVPQHRDRTKEYLTLSKELDNAVAFNGGLWDFDALLTMRTGLTPILKMLATSPRNHHLSWMKQIWVIEAMVLMEFKKTVMTFETVTQDLFTLAGYLAADRVYLTSQTDRSPIVRRARELLPPSLAIQVSAKVIPVSYAQFFETTLKTPDQFPDPNNGKPLCIAHAGRMEKANRIVEINDLMVKHFALQGDKVELLVCTVSNDIKVFDLDIVEVQQASRDEFWELCKTRMHVIVKMSDEGGSSLSLMEPMMMGVPAVVGPRKLTEQALGKDYPFIVNNEVEAYAIVKMFLEDYAGMYAKWAEWQQTSLKAMLEQRAKEASVYQLLDQDIDAFSKVDDRLRAERPTKQYKAFVSDLLDHLGDAQEFVLQDVVADMVEKKKVSPKILEKLDPNDRDSRGLVWSTDFNDIRRILFAFYGWEDASVKVGHMRKKQEA